MRSPRAQSRAVPAIVGPPVPRCVPSHPAGNARDAAVGGFVSRVRGGMAGVTSQPRHHPGRGGPSAPYRLVRPPPPPCAPVLDPAQQAVVDHRGGPLLVLAGPGTGKTTTLVEAAVDAGRAGRRPGVAAGADVQPPGRGRAAGADHRPARPHHPRAARPHLPLLRVRPAAPRGGGPGRARPAAALRPGAGPGRARPAGRRPRGRRARLAGRLRPALRTRGFAQELRDLLLRAVERGVGPGELAGWGREHGRDDWLAAAHVLRRVRRGHGAASTRRPTTRPSSSGPRSSCWPTTPTCWRPSGPAPAGRVRRRVPGRRPGPGRLLRLLAGGGRRPGRGGRPGPVDLRRSAAPTPTAIRRLPRDVPHPAPATPAPVVSPGHLPPVRLPTLLAAVAAGSRPAARARGSHRRPASPPPGCRPAESRCTLLRVRAPGGGATSRAPLRAAHLLDGVPWREMAVLVRSTGAPCRCCGGRWPPPVCRSPWPATRCRCAQRAARPAAAGRAARARTRPEPLDEDAARRAAHLAARRRRRAGAAPAAAGAAPRSSGRRRAAAGRPDRCSSRRSSEPASARPPLERCRDAGRRTARRPACWPAAAGGCRRTRRRPPRPCCGRSGSARAGRAAGERRPPRGRRRPARADRDLDAVVALFDAAARFVDRLPAGRPAGVPRPPRAASSSRATPCADGRRTPTPCGC